METTGEGERRPDLRLSSIGVERFQRLRGKRGLRVGRADPGGTGASMETERPRDGVCCQREGGLHVSTHTFRRQGLPDAGSIHYPSFSVTKLLFCLVTLPSEARQDSQPPLQLWCGPVECYIEGAEKLCGIQLGRADLLSFLPLLQPGTQMKGVAAATLGYEVISQREDTGKKVKYQRMRSPVIQ